jgi:hypothetical protein
VLGDTWARQLGVALGPALGKTLGTALGEALTRGRAGCLSGACSPSTVGEARESWESCLAN